MLELIRGLELMDVTIEAKDVFDRYISVSNNKVSEITFTNLFAWRDSYKLKYALYGDYLLLISFRDIDNPYAFLPIGDITGDRFADALMCLKNYFTSNGYNLIIKKVYEDYVPHVLNILGHGYVSEYDRDNSDYLYLASNLSTLRGKKYHRKKNHVNKFMSTYRYEYEKIDNVNKMMCYNILNKWMMNKEVVSDDYKREALAIKNIVENFEKLDCIGAIVNVEGEAEGFTFGEIMNNDTAVIHIEKVNTKIQGLGEFINWKFCKENFSNIKYINREQDLGIDGLRKAKKSYLPERLINKYIIQPESS